MHSFIIYRFPYSFWIAGNKHLNDKKKNLKTHFHDSKVTSSRLFYELIEFQTTFDIIGLLPFLIDKLSQFKLRFSKIIYILVSIESWNWLVSWSEIKINDYYYQFFFAEFFRLECRFKKKVTAKRLSGNLILLFTAKTAVCFPNSWRCGVFLLFYFVMDISGFTKHGQDQVTGDLDERCCIQFLR